MQLQRYFIKLSYAGTRYHGWQIQPNAVSVQELLEKALATVFRQPVPTTGCGRTDTGVHASEFFAHADLPASLVSGTSVNRLNALLPHDIAVAGLIPVSAEAHARFDATQRSYVYRIHFRKDPFLHERSWLMRDVPDLAAMNEAANILLQYTDFSCFSKSNTQVFTNNCRISKAEWVATHEGIAFHISADRFLRNMVRAIVGTLVDIGRSKMPTAEMHQIIGSKNRAEAGASVPACGLYLNRIEYPYLTGIEPAYDA
jgi:tRNA pseudouridine38-40 synthase